MNKPVSRPLAPWDIVAPDAYRAKSAAMGNLAGRVFAANLNVTDLDYIGRAVLQMADENYEMREQIRLLQAAVRELTGAK